MTIKLGLYLATQFVEGAHVARHVDEIIAQTHAARDAGFHSLWAAQHYGIGPIQMLQPTPLLARLIPESGNMMLGPNILVLPVLNPVLVAEEAATIDVMSGGRYILGVGLGYRDEEFEMAGIEK
ncbi:MAG: LLM class flavin-dependent oxidoreductase, partial [Planctomycetes bacterium]|nr:LLM class flavin-dependent oxidoreductase [Planctomycetota bacterium]